MSKKKKQPFNPKIKNQHHILWPASKYSTGYAKRLRLHPWLIMAIPRDTLHKEIHSKIAEIPIPSGPACKRAYIKLLADLEAGIIDDSNTLEERVEWLINCWSLEDYPLTAISLWYQKEIVSNFYRKPPA